MLTSCKKSSCAAFILCKTAVTTVLASKKYSDSRKDLSRFCSASRVNHLVQNSGVPAYQSAYLHRSTSEAGPSPLPYNEFVDFKLVSSYKPQGDQGRAIDTLIRGVFDREQHQVLLGVTGSGKTFTAAKVIEAANRPALVMAHNKTLAAQLYHEFKNFFPQNAVEYFVSYYDYYQPEAYVPAADLYIEKEATINEEIDRLRLSATRALFERRDVIVVASVSCIYGLGDPDAYFGMLVFIEPGQKIKREEFLQKLVELQYERVNIDFDRGVFRVRGDVVELYPS